MKIDDARDLLRQAIADRVFPSAVVEVGADRGPMWREAFGTLTFDAGARPATDDTIFDLASLTKPIASATVAAQLVAKRALALDEPLTRFFVEWRGADRERATVRDLLEHAAGLPARLVDRPPEGRREFEHDICTMPLEYAVREKSLYSDLGFIILGFLLGDRGGRSLAAQFGVAMDRLRTDAEGAGPMPQERDLLAFDVPVDARKRTAPTWPLDEDRRSGRILIGEVHDSYAAALGGVAGHAGLFGTVRSIGVFARAMLRGARGDASAPLPFSPALVRLLTARSAVPGSSRALGWDTMLPTSSCGTRLSPAAFGHVGFTGTSLWIDPTLDRYFVLLTNRVCGGGTLDEMRTVRRAFHDAVAIE